MFFKRKAQFLELDIIFAVFLLIAGVLLLKLLFIHSFEVPQTNSYARDSLSLLSYQRLSSFNDSFLYSLRSSFGSDIDFNETVARQALIFIINNRSDLAALLVNHSLSSIIPANYGFNVSIISNLNHYIVFSSNKPFNHSVAVARSMLTGLEVGKPVYGFSGNIFLSSPVVNRSKYFFFGGFVGQGVISSFFSIPDDAVVNSLFLEGDFHDDFSFLLNNVSCANVSIPPDPDPFSSITVASLDSCLDVVNHGINNFSIVFNHGDVKNHYVGGGFLRVSYFSSNPVYPSYHVKKFLPGINGIFNLYDGFVVPGVLDSLSVHLHYLANHSNQSGNVIFTIGNTTLLFDNDSVDEQVVDFSNDFLSSMINYSLFTNMTVPLRFGFDNQSVILKGGVASVSLITDVSWSMNGDFSLGSDPESLDCDELDDYLASNPNADRVQRLLLAKCVDKLFARIILNNSDPGDNGSYHNITHLGLVSYGPVTMDKLSLSTNLSLITNTIDNYDFPLSPLHNTPWYGTCTACSIKSATDQLKDLPAGVPKAMIIMSDGGTNACYRGCDYDNLSACVGFSQQNNDCDPQQQAVDFARVAHEKYNITIYTVAFGHAAYFSLKQIADETNGFFYEGNDSNELRQVYSEIADNILSSAYSSQVFIQVSNVSSIVYPDSFVEYSYKPFPLESDGSIIVSGEDYLFSNPDSCTSTSFSLPSVVKPLNAFISSYSGPHWTNFLSVNDNVVFDLDSYGSDYSVLGDPFVFLVPNDFLLNNNNRILLTTADSPSNVSGCSVFDKIIYYGLINSTVVLDSVYPFADGCLWNVSFPLGSRLIRIPSDYNGSSVCNYSSSLPGFASFNDSDAWQVLGFKLFNKFDFDPRDGVVDISFSDFNIQANLESAQLIPYMWGPAVLEVVVWQ